MRNLRLGDEYERTGKIARTFGLADDGILDALANDAATFRTAVDELRREGHFRVPYICTEAIRAVAHDDRIIEVVQAVLGEVPWVMWGPNIREGTPNEAHRWHVDLESWHWPSVTVVVGISGCLEQSATRCIPYSHRLKRHPSAAPDDGDTEGVLRTARSLDRRCNLVQMFEGFRTGRFYVFNARVWHCGNPTQSRDRCALFLHYQRATDPRVPYMKDYRRGTFYSEPASYIEGPCGDGPPANRAVSPVPWRCRLVSWASFLRRWSP